MIRTMEKKIDFAIGGQALIEGVMMRSPHFISIAVRKKNGEIVTKVDKHISFAQRLKVHKIPIIRGVIGVIEMMFMGTRALDFATEVYLDEPESETEKINKNEVINEDPSKLKAFLKAIGLFVSLGISLIFVFILFKFVPLYSTEFLRTKWSILSDNYILFNLVDGIIRIAIFFGYISILFAFKSFRRVFQYHGAEHMAVHTYEHKKNLTTKEVRAFRPEHPRCGTSFLMAVLLVSIIVYSLVPRQDDFLINLLLRLSIVPLIAGIGYEILKWSAKHVDHALMKIIIAPGMLTQYITTQQPDDDQIEVAITALKNAIAAEEKA